MKIADGAIHVTRAELKYFNVDKLRKLAADHPGIPLRLLGKPAPLTFEQANVLARQNKVQVHDLKQLELGYNRSEWEASIIEAELLTDDVIGEAHVSELNYDYVDLYVNRAVHIYDCAFNDVCVTGAPMVRVTRCDIRYLAVNDSLLLNSSKVHQVRAREALIYNSNIDSVFLSKGCLYNSKVSSDMFLGDIKVSGRSESSIAGFTTVPYGVLTLSSVGACNRQITCLVGPRDTKFILGCFSGNYKETVAAVTSKYGPSKNRVHKAAYLAALEGLYKTAVCVRKQQQVIRRRLIRLHGVAFTNGEGWENAGVPTAGG